MSLLSAIRDRIYPTAPAPMPVKPVKQRAKRRNLEKLYPESAALVVDVTNPKRSGTQAWDRYATYQRRDINTVEDAMACGIIRREIDYDVSVNHLKIAKANRG